MHNKDKTTTTQQQVFLMLLKAHVKAVDIDLRKTNQEVFCGFVMAKIKAMTNQHTMFPYIKY